MFNRSKIKPFTIWFTGLSGSGKTTLCTAVTSKFRALGLPVQMLDGDQIRQDLSPDLGFAIKDRIENIRRLIYVADLLVCNDIIVLVAAISPLRVMREDARRKIGSFLEVFVDAPIEICETRDPKGLYRKARQGCLTEFTGISATYEPPPCPDVVCHTDLESVSECTEKVVSQALKNFCGLATPPSSQERLAVKNLKKLWGFARGDVYSRGNSLPQLRRRFRSKTASITPHWKSRV